MSSDLGFALAGTCFDSCFFSIGKDGHNSKFDLEWIQKVFEKPNKLKPKLWGPGNFPGLSNESMFDFKSYASYDSKDTLKKALESLIINGYTVISDSPVSSEGGTLVVAKRIGPIMPGS